MVQFFVLEIEELVAAEADQVVVKLQPRIEASDPSWVARFGDHTHPGKVLERTVDGRAGDSGKAFLDGIEDLVGRWVIVETEDGLEDHSSLHRTALSAFAAELSEKLDPFCPCRLVQAAPRFMPSLVMIVDENM